MNRDDLENMIKDSGLSLFFRQDHLIPGSLRFFCPEKDRFVVEDFISRFIPLGIWVDIITENHDYRDYQLPRTTLKQHLQDCFGWLTC